MEEFSRKQIWQHRRCHERDELESNALEISLGRWHTVLTTEHRSAYSRWHTVLMTEHRSAYSRWYTVLTAALCPRLYAAKWSLAQSATGCTLSGVRSLAQSATGCTLSSVRSLAQSATGCTLSSVQSLAQCATGCTLSSVRSLAQLPPAARWEMYGR